MRALTSRTVACKTSSKAVRDDVTEADLALVPVMVGADMDTVRRVEEEPCVDADLWRRALALVMHGLQPGPPVTLPGHTPSTDQFDEMPGVGAPRPPED